MKTSLLAFILVTAPLVIGCVIGCVETEVQAQPPFPQNVGYTPPSDVPMPPPPAPPLAQGAQGDSPEAPAIGAQGPSQEVVVGGADGDTPAADSDGYADTDPSALTDFRSTLDPYGTWSEDPTYGSVWVPSQAVVGEDFTPYVSAGRWAYDNDYVWVSDYDWGWAPFHYGRWVYGRSAWEWIPGRAYAGAWASWRYGEFGYVGWAPLPPTWGWRGGCAVGLGFVPSAPYTFVGTEHLFSPSLGEHVVAGGQVGVIAAHTRPWVPASPGVAGHSAAHPAVGGPPPSALHIQAAAIARVEPSDRGLAQARAFSRVSTATTLGARTPQTAAAGSRAAFASGMVRGPAYAAGQSHFGGRFGAGFSGSVGAAAPMRSPYSGGARPAYGASPAYGGRFSSGAPARSFGSYGAAYGGAHASPFAGAYHGGGSPPEFHGGGGFTGGGSAYHGSVSGGGGGHGGGHR
jgi:hypothetical protein